MLLNVAFVQLTETHFAAIASLLPMEDKMESQVHMVDAQAQFQTRQLAEFQTRQLAQDWAFCTCKKIRCLRQYCSCFRKNILCLHCQCNDCENDGRHETTRLLAIRKTRLQDPNAFKGTSAQLHTRVHIARDGKQMQISGCRCIKSKCKKSYCECFRAGMHCADNCICENCENNITVPKAKKMADSTVRDMPTATPVVVEELSESELDVFSDSDRNEDYKSSQASGHILADWDATGQMSPPVNNSLHDVMPWEAIDVVQWSTSAK